MLDFQLFPPFARGLSLCFVVGFLWSCGAAESARGINLNLHVTRLVSGEPLEDAEVLFLDEMGFVQSETYRTDPDGRLEASLPPGNYTVHLRAWRHDILPGKVSGVPEINVPESGVLTVEVQTALREGLGKTGWVDVLVVDEHDAPVAGALVIAYREDLCNTATGQSWGYADLLGQARVTNLAPGPYTVKAYGRELGPQFVGSATVQEGTGNSVAAKVGVHSGGLANVTGSLSGMAGAVTLSLHEPITGALVPGTRTRVTDGQFTWADLPSGRFLVQADSESDDLIQDPADIHRQSFEVVRAATSCTPSETRTEGSAVDTVDVKEITTALQFVSAMSIVSPAGGVEVPEPPELVWQTLPNTDFYVVEVRDSSGHTVFGGFALDETPRLKVPPDVSSLVYGDLSWANVDKSYIPAENLTTGSVYAWRVHACQLDASAPRGARVMTSSVMASGRFIYAPPPEE